MKREKAFSIENNINSFIIATVKQNTVICDILIRVRENFQNFVIFPPKKSELIQNSFSCFSYTNWPYFRLVETFWIPNNIKMLGCPYTFTMYNVTLMQRQTSVEVNEKHSFSLRWDLCLTLSISKHVTGVIGFQKLIYTCQKVIFRL